MFQSYSKRLCAWLEVVDDMLAGDEPPADAPLEAPLWAAHPHRRPLRSQRARRPGRGPAAPAHCLCPVRPVMARGVERTVHKGGRALTN